MGLMLMVTACYTITSLSDSHGVAKLKFDGNALTFFMAAATALFMLAALPFDSRLFVLSWQSFAAIALMVISKMMEFQLAAIVLKDMTAFELKAWVGLTVFASYGVDLLTGVSPWGMVVLVKLAFITATAVGLFMIARSGKEKIDYKKIALPLIGYLAAKFGYGLTVQFTKAYISPTLSLFFALVILAVILAPATHPIKLIKEKPGGTAFLSLTKIPNVIGLVGENALAAQSMASYSLVQPMILATLFFIGLIRKQETGALNIIGGVICIAGVIAFKLIG